MTAPTAPAAPAAPGPRPRRRALRALATGLLLLLPSAALFGLSWSSADAEAEALAAAGTGADYVRPVGAVLAVLAEGQAAAATGAPIDGEALRRAVDEVDRVDALHGAALGVGERWQEVRAEALALADRPAPDGPGGVAALARDLAGAATEASGAARAEPALGALAGTAVPALLAASAEQVAALAEVREDDAASAGRASAAQELLREAVAAVDDQLARLAAGASVVSAAEEALVVRAGDLRAAAAPLVPVGAAVTDAARARSAQEVLVRSGAELHRAALDVLAERVQSRLSALELRQAGLGAAAVLAVVVAGAVAWTGLGRRPEPVEQGGRTELDENWSDPRSREVVMVDARSLLGVDGDAEEVVRIGRAVRRRWEIEDEPS